MKEWEKYDQWVNDLNQQTENKEITKEEQEHSMRVVLKTIDEIDKSGESDEIKLRQLQELVD